MGGFVLVEAMMALAILTVLGLVLLKLSINILHPRQWVIQQTLSDAYMTYERSLAERVPFDVLVGPTSLWPDINGQAGNRVATTASIEIGRLPAIFPSYPQGVPVIGTVSRTRIADPGNYPVDGGDPASRQEAIARNPAAMKVWRLQSVLTYRVGDRTYSKSRTVLRTQ